MTEDMDDIKTTVTRTAKFALIPVLMAYLAMGFVDIVNIGSNYVKNDLGLTDSQANFMPAMLFFWFLICSVPVSILMNKIGRKNTVLISLILSLISVLIPLFGDSYYVMLVAFAVLGIGNAFMQTSLNPLVTNVVRAEKVSPTLTFGQFMKACLASCGPIICAWGAAHLSSTFGYGWRIVFLIYSVIGIICTLWLLVTPIEREVSDKVSGFKECFILLGKGLILMSFIGIICHVGVDVGICVTGPRLLMERCGMELGPAGIAVTVYLVFRMVGSITATALLQKMPAKLFYFISTVCLTVGLIGWIFFSSATMIYICVALLGFGNSNVFPLILTEAMLRFPNEKNEISGLMVMGLFGGTIFPIVMGWASDLLGGQVAAICVMIVGALYLVYYTKLMKSENV